MLLALLLVLVLKGPAKRRHAAGKVGADVELVRLIETREARRAYRYQGSGGSM